jgi:hypothetical protein
MPAEIASHGRTDGNRRALVKTRLHQCGRPLRPGQQPRVTSMWLPQAELALRDATTPGVHAARLNPFQPSGPAWRLALLPVLAGMRWLVRPGWYKSDLTPASQG